jgi:phage terminase large subunit-like protein
VLPKDLIKNWNRSLGELDLHNGSHVKLFSAEQPDRLRGPQHHHAWCDELAAWKYPETFDQLLFGLRLGSRPQIVVTTTPRRTPLIVELVKRAKADPEDVFMTAGSTYDNAAHLAPVALAQLKLRYEGTRLGRQELFAELLEDVEGALWDWQMVEACRGGPPAAYKRIVVGVDPSGGGGAEQGIVVCGLGKDGRYYVLADRTCRLSPDGWGRRAVDAYHEFGADRIVAEGNFGGDMVEAVIRNVDPSCSYRKVTASRGKRQRAEPVVALYEQGHVTHLGVFAELEDQMTTWVPDADFAQPSPDRVDALVWAVSDLMSRRALPNVGPSGATGPSAW